MNETSRIIWLLLEALLPDPATPPAKPPVELHTVRPAVSCRLDVSQSGSRKSIVALASSASAHEVDYVLEIETHGANTSRTRQGGTVALMPGAEAELAVARVTGNARGRLLLEWDGESAECKLP